MGAEAAILPSHFVSCRRTPSPGHAAEAMRALESAGRSGLCRTHAFCALPTGVSALVTCDAVAIAALRSRLQVPGTPPPHIWPVTDLLPQRLLVSHIDAEPVRAAIARDPRGYAHSSLGLRHAGAGPWLEDSWLAAASARAGGYFEAFPALRRPEPVAALVAQAGRAGGMDPSIEEFRRGDLGSAARHLLHRLAHPDRGCTPLAPPEALRLASDDSLGRGDADVVLLRVLSGESAGALAGRRGCEASAVREILARTARHFAAHTAALVAVAANACRITDAFYAPWGPEHAPEIRRLAPLRSPGPQPATRGLSA
ncbi:MAG: hypothetical protein ACO3UM_02165 [Planctomycetota bacterium]